MLDLSMASAMLSHGPTINVTHLHMISTRRLAISITFDASSMSHEHPIFRTAQDSMVCSVGVLIFAAHLFITGAKRLISEHEQLPSDHRYLRCVEQHDLPSDNEFRLIVCMTSRMSLLLVQAKRISIDTSFKHVRGWQKFEIEGWDTSHQRCEFKSFFVYCFCCKSNSMIAMVFMRAFTTSQSADAHVILFRRIFSIAEQDTGVPVKFFHIHDMGIESVIADGHRGQALGIFFLAFSI
jgi:hypothetical protein